MLYNISDFQNSQSQQIFPIYAPYLTCEGKIWDVPHILPS